LRPSSPHSREQRLSAFPSDSAQCALPFVLETLDGSPDTLRLAPRPLDSLASPGEENNPAAQLTESHAEVGQNARQNRKRGRTERPNRNAISPDAKLLVSRNVAAEMLSISVRSVDYMIAARRLSTRRIANRVLIPTDEIRKFARSDHPGRVAALPISKVNHQNGNEAGNAAERDRRMQRGESPARADSRQSKRGT
jgi:hypothetical protein